MTNTSVHCLANTSGHCMSDKYQWPLLVSPIPMVTKCLTNTGGDLLNLWASSCRKPNTNALTHTQTDRAKTSLYNCCLFVRFICLPNCDVHGFDILLLSRGDTRPDVILHSVEEWSVKVTGLSKCQNIQKAKDNLISL